MSVMPDPADKPIKILVIDDEKDWCERIGMYAELLECDWEPASSFEEAKTAIKKAEETGDPFSVATIDMAFEVGRRKTQTPLGKGILRYIKSKHPYIACIMVSGSPEVRHQVLDLRDDYELDEYILKDRFDLDTFHDKIAKAIKRVRPLGEEMAKEIIPAGMAKIVKSLERQLDAHCSNLDNLEEQRATFAKGEEPLRLLNQIDHEKKEIERLQAKLRKFKEAPDHTDST